MSTQTADFLIEFFGEEIPARMQLNGAENFKRLFLEQFQFAGLPFQTAQAYVTPRRLTLHVTGLPLIQQDQQIEKRGPKVGAPEQAIQGFLRSMGLSDIQELEQRETDKGLFYFAFEHVIGSPTASLLPGMVQEVFHNLTWPKSMNWGSNSKTWVRPLRRILCLFDGKTVEGSLDLGGEQLPFTNETNGHRFLAPQRFSVQNFENYQEQLKQSFVMLDNRERRQYIWNQMQQQAQAMGCSVIEDADLLDEVTGLVEWPVVLRGDIDAHYMQLPPEVLITSLKINQKYFMLRQSDGQLAPYYFIISNIAAHDNGAEIIKGNGRVLNARLSDAQFFYTQDQRKPLETFLNSLSSVVFHLDLGSMSARVERLKKLARLISPILGLDAKKAERAAMLAKADLTTEMVGEFATLQGTMGYYYALNQGEDLEIAEAIVDHYQPKGPQDNLPRHTLGQLIALSDKMDTLVGFFAVGIKPTGSKDPFALRRCALGIIRILEKHPLLNLVQLVRNAYEAHQPTMNAEKACSLETCEQEVMAFLIERLKVYWQDQGLRPDCIEAVLHGTSITSIAQQRQKALALQSLLTEDEGKNLVITYKRASHIVSIEEKKDQRQYQGNVDSSQLVDSYEITLFENLQAAVETVQTYLAQHAYQEAMATVAKLRPSIDAFFEHVIVNAEETAIRHNRLELLAMIRATLADVAAFDKLEV